MDLAAWIRETTGGASARSIAVKLNRSPDSVARWLREGTMPPEDIIRLSRAYRGNLLAGSLAAGALTVDDIEEAMPNLLRMATSVQIIEELHRRAVAAAERRAAETA